MVLLVHLGKKIVIEAMRKPSIFIQFALELTGGPSGMTEEAGQFDIWVFIPEKLRLFQIDPEIQLEGRGAVQPFPTGDDQLFFFDGTAFENRDVRKVNNLKLLVQITEPFSRRPVQDDTQGAMIFGMRRKKNDRFEEIRIP